MRRNGYERTNQKSLCLRAEDVGVAAAGGVHRRLPSGVVRHGGEGQQLHRQRAGGGGEHPLRHLPSLGEAPPYARHGRRALPAAGDLLHRLPRHDCGRGDLAAPVVPVGEQSGAAGRGAGRPRAHRRHPHHPRLRLRTDVHSRHRPRTVRGTADHVPLLDWHGVENVHREHRGS